MLRTIMLFLATNFLIMITISIVLHVFGIGHYIVAGGIDYTSLMIFCLVWGMGFSFMSLLLSKVIAKWSMGVQTVSPQFPGEYGWVATKVQELARAAQLPAMPEVGVYESAELNAFATGPSKKNSLVAVKWTLGTYEQRCN
ncbi:MAG: M48 family metalloprotease [SAR324 cluster bacterium]|uniref:M48 family metalloprotease n=1 Tax=SAR324 cluster bacterium TaxID=2024889 RepID=A0A7X9FUC2_9DELT|nr:M48 family metalloprotease [SAR324 cluster bacterium]